MELFRDYLILISNQAKELAYLEKEHGISLTDLPKMLEGKDNIVILKLLLELSPQAQAALLNLIANVQPMLTAMTSLVTMSVADKFATAEMFSKQAKSLGEAIGESKVITIPTDLDKDLEENCNNKNYRDTIANAFPLIEDRLRKKVGVGREIFGSDLVDYAFGPKNGKLILGVTEAEREGTYFLFKGAFLYLRNPSNHTMEAKDSRNAAIKIMHTADHLLKLIDKAQLRST